MKKMYLSLICASVILNANETISLETIEVNEKTNVKTFKNVSSKELKSADLAEALSKNLSSISLVRRSAIANDIIVRGAKKDNINFLIDGAKIYGACPNRMDPSSSHVLSNSVENVEIIEGPFDVENFGSLSAVVKVKTKKIKEGFNAEIDLNAGSFSYKKASATVSGGNKNIKALLSISSESSNQYKDGDGNTLYEQVENSLALNDNKRYKQTNENKKAFEKKMLLSKLNINLDDKQELAFSYTANRSDEILYPSTPMDAIKDDSDIFTFKYKALNLAKYSDNLELSSYYSKVEHPMSTEYRESSDGMMGAMVNNTKSSIKGLKLKNIFTNSKTQYTLGLDSSIRNWQGFYSNDMNSYVGDSISSSDTKNKALFFKTKSNLDNFTLELASRVDNTSIEVKDSTLDDKDYKSLSGNIFLTYTKNSMKYFIGLGKAYRVPDARELYFKKSNNHIGNDNLNQVSNTELDIGFKRKSDESIYKGKLFYSSLKDYIAFNSSKTTNSFENINAYIYGFELSTLNYLNDDFFIDSSLTYLKGKKKEPLENQLNKNLAEIPPLKAKLSLNYEKNKQKFKILFLASKAWTNFDNENGEQYLPSYFITNLKYTNEMIKNTSITLGIDNLFDKSYASSNTYKDLTLMDTDSKDRMLLNEPGRYFYTNIKYKF